MKDLAARLRRETRLLAHLLHAQKQTLVLAESCTGGLIASLLTAEPGISAVFAGSSVVYQLDTKACWLGLDPALFRKNPDAVSESVARAMSKNLLTQTPHATVAAAITGLMGGDRKSSADGHVYIAVSYRQKQPAHRQSRRALIRTLAQEFWILPGHLTRSNKSSPKKLRSASPLKLRHQRQRLASLLLLSMVRSLLNTTHHRPK